MLRKFLERIRPMDKSALIKTENLPIVSVSQQQQEIDFKNEGIT